MYRTGDADSDPIDNLGVLKVDGLDSACEASDPRGESNDKEFERFQCVVRHNPE